MSKNLKQPSFFSSNRKPLWWFSFPRNSSFPRKRESRNIIPSCTVLLILLLSVHIEKAESFVCKPITDEDKSKSTFCFFSLNNPKEYTTLKTRYKEDPLEKCLQEAQDPPDKYKCEQQFEKIEIKEFYGKAEDGTDKASVKKRFKEMLKTSECDSLTVSGHHTGYFAGEQSIGGNEDWKLDLDFMEELSCEPDCADWFSNVKSLFLMGCRTVRTPEALSTEESADDHTIRVIGKNSSPVKASYIHMIVNQAFSSNLAEHDMLNDRYLQMFPESSLYGWRKWAPGKDNQSDESLPNFIKLVGNLQEKQNPTNTDDIFNFISFMNSQGDTCKQYGSRIWANHWSDYWERLHETTGDKPTTCFLDDSSKKQFQEYQQIGCNLTQALNSEETDQTKKTDKIKKEAVANILKLGEEGIRANFNRLMSLITNKKNKDESWYSEVVNTLKENGALKTTIVNGVKSEKMGFVRKADYLYFYREMGWENSTKDQEISKKFLKQLQKAFDDGKKTHNPNNKAEGDAYKVEKAHQRAIIRSINDNTTEDNNLMEWLFRNNKDEFNKLKDKLIKDGWEWLKDVPPDGWNFPSS